jgi:actin-related protein 2
MGMEADGVGEMCHEAIKDCPIDCRKALYSTVLTSGGTSMFPGYSTRLENELEKLWL